MQIKIKIRLIIVADVLLPLSVSRGIRRIGGGSVRFS